MRKVQWSDDALADIARQVDYIAHDDPDAAAMVVQRIRSTGIKLGEFATGHPGRIATTYEKTVARTPYIIAYTLSDDGSVVSILHVIHAARDWASDRWPS